MAQDDRECEEPVRKRKRAETKTCPVCHESIPIRLLATHAELESARVQDIMNGIGSSEVLVDEFEQGSSSQSRRSAVRARKSFNSRQAVADTLEQTAKTIQTINRHRKQRHAKLRELTRGEDEGGKLRWDANEIVCPVCSQTVRGDADVIEAHVDTCIAHQASRAQEETERASQEDAWEEIEADGEMRIRVTDSASLRGLGFHVRDHNEQDVEDEVDVDGDDEAVFGGAQFTEGDILCPGNDPRAADAGIQVDDGPSEHKSLRDLVIEGKVVKRLPSEETSENSSSLIGASRDKFKQPQSLVCRICLDPYVEPTVSTGCWHTCCRDCWLRCLGSTKLCPICKRITAAIDLRRIYL